MFVCVYVCMYVCIYEYMVVDVLVCVHTFNLFVFTRIIPQTRIGDNFTLASACHEQC